MRGDCIFYCLPGNHRTSIFSGFSKLGSLLHETIIIIIIKKMCSGNIEKKVGRTVLTFNFLKFSYPRNTVDV